VSNIYLPEIATITEVREETPDTKTFTCAFRGDGAQRGFTFRPGQFAEVSVFGYGEAPFCICSSPTRKENFQFTVRTVGELTRALHALGPGDEVGVRAPLGNEFLCERFAPEKVVAERNVLFIGGGIGLPPLRSLIWYMLDQRNRFKRIQILYGARTPTDLVYKDELKMWGSRQDVEFHVTVDRAEPGWTGNVGIVSTLFEKVKIEPQGTMAFLCGPPVMIRFVMQDLLAMGFAEDAIVTTLERHMKCGVGKCNHCAIGHKYVCLDGPVFTYAQIKHLMEPS
jgi:NAD(P)H-flavin reductase